MPLSFEQRVISQVPSSSRGSPLLAYRFPFLLGYFGPRWESALLVSTYPFSFFPFFLDTRTDSEPLMRLEPPLLCRSFCIEARDEFPLPVLALSFGKGTSLVPFSWQTPLSFFLPFFSFSSKNGHRILSFFLEIRRQFFFFPSPAPRDAFSPPLFSFFPARKERKFHPPPQANPGIIHATAPREAPSSFPFFLLRIGFFPLFGPR